MRTFASKCILATDLSLITLGLISIVTLLLPHQQALVPGTTYDDPFWSVFGRLFMLIVWVFVLVSEVQQWRLAWLLHAIPILFWVGCVIWPWIATYGKPDPEYNVALYLVGIPLVLISSIYTIAYFAKGRAEANRHTLGDNQRVRS